MKYSDRPGLPPCETPVVSRAWRAFDLQLAFLAVFRSLLVACAPTRHLLAPYRHDATMARGLEERAVAYCRAVQPDDAAPGELRGTVDAELRRCVGADHSEIVALLMHLGTRLFADSWVPAGWRWPRVGPAPAAEADARPTPPDEGTTTRSPADVSCAGACLSRAGPRVGRTPFGSGGESPPGGPGSPPGLRGAPVP